MILPDTKDKLSIFSLLSLKLANGMNISRDFREKINRRSGVLSTKEIFINDPTGGIKNHIKDLGLTEDPKIGERY